MKNIIITIFTTVAVLGVIGKIDQQKKEIKDLDARLERVGRFSDLYYQTLTDTVRKLDGEERRATVRKFNSDVDFLRIVNHM
jgi:hypothetical protein